MQRTHRADPCHPGGRRFLGIAAYEIEGPSHRILIDPFLTGNPSAPLGADDLQTPDVILVTHAAFDHLGDAAAIGRRTGAPVIGGADVQAVMLEEGLPQAQVRATVQGICVDVNGLLVRPVESHHWSSARLKDGRTIPGVPIGFIVEPEPGVRIYHFGDSAVFGDMRLIGELYQPTIGLLGCTQPWPLVGPGAGRVATGEMSPREAALAAELLGLQVAVACHYADTHDPDVQQFLQLVPEIDTSGARLAMALEPDEVLVVADGGRSYEREPYRR